MEVGIKASWFADLANYIVSGFLPDEMEQREWRKLRNDAKRYFWNDPHLFRKCEDGMFRRCVSREEGLEIVDRVQNFAYGGHLATSRTTAKILQGGIYWPSMFKDIHYLVKSCDACQRIGNIGKRSEMPLTNILEIELFDCWGIDFMGPFPNSCGNEYILVAVDYVSKWIEAVTAPTNDSKVVMKLFKGTIFPRFGTPRVVISDGGSHFRKKMNFDFDAAGEIRFLQMNELEELRLEAYESSKIYKDQTKKWHDGKIMKKEIGVGDLVLLFNSKIKVFPGKLKSRWSGPFKVMRIFPYGAFELWSEEGGTFRVNGQRIKR
ncbi:uncharacterized protein LOC141651876 [Silene latifolia]|uniref:uncharacterized protein LOC141651876 n=1 Tax=Silene latifolia TaxID=37657 RepID=UPI003D76D5BD